MYPFNIFETKLNYHFYLEGFHFSSFVDRYSIKTSVYYEIKKIAINELFCLIGLFDLDYYYFINSILLLIYKNTDILTMNNRRKILEMCLSTENQRRFS